MMLADCMAAHSSPQKKVTDLLIENSVFIGGMNEAKCFEQRPPWLVRVSSAGNPSALA
jgi:hypothetical protein